MKTIRQFFLIICISFTNYYAQETLLDPKPSTASQDSLINVGTQLHDEGKYDEAIKMYLRVLNENPANIAALYEISSSSLAKKNYADAIKYATIGIGYKSEARGGFYICIANAFDEQGKSEEAIAKYHEGISINPKNYLLYFNLGVTYYRKNLFDSARVQLHKSLKINPLHASSNLLLGGLYYGKGKNVPAFLAYSRFLVTEPATSRSGNALKKWKEILTSYVKVDKDDPKKINVNITPDSSAEDGDMTVLAMSLGLKMAAIIGEGDKGLTEMQKDVQLCESFFAIMSELKERGTYSGFIWDYYAPYFEDMNKQGLIETFVYIINCSSDSDEVNKWLQANNDKVEKFLTWNKQYSWQK